MSYRARPAGAAAEGEWRVPLALPNLEGYSLALAPKRLANFFISRRRLLDDFVEDVRLTWFNAKIYNRPADSSVLASSHSQAPTWPM